MALIKQVTNSKHTRIILNWAYKGMDRKEIVEPYALNQEVSFADEDDFKALCEQLPELFDRNILIFDKKIKAKDLDKTAEKNEKDQRKTYKDNNKTEEKVEFKAKGTGKIAEAEIKVTDDNGNKVD